MARDAGDYMARRKPAKGRSHNLSSRRASRAQPSSAPRLPTTTPNAWAVSEEVIRYLNDRQLNGLMRELLEAEVYRSGANISLMFVNTEVDAPDDGCDGLTPPPASRSVWLGGTETCWQFKAGKAGQPSKLTREAAKKKAAETLRNGGRLVVVASASADGSKGRNARLAKLKIGARSARVPVENLEVLTSETLTSWVNQLPSVAAHLGGLPSHGWCTFAQWEQAPEHLDSPWQANKSITDSIGRLQQSLDLRTGSETHLHVYGPSGVGKTRFVLEACRTAPWRELVLYAPTLGDAAFDLIDAVAEASEKQLIFVLDEVPQEVLIRLNAAARRADGRVRLVTIGHDGSTDSRNISELRMDPLEEQSMAGLIRGLHPNMPREHVDFVVSFAGGYVRLAQLAARAVAENPTIDVGRLFRRNDIRQLLDAMLGRTVSRSALYVVGVLTSVGWEGERAIEGEAIAKHLGQDWNSVRLQVEDFDRQFHIVPRGGDLRYISPTPLAVYLASEAWSTLGERLRTLDGVLPTDGAKKAYYERLRAAMAVPQAKSFAETELARFSNWQHFVDPRGVQRWSAFSVADPIGAANSVRKVLQEATKEDRLKISDGARRHLVWALIELAWGSRSFVPAMLALADLAAAENEKWANNATNEFLTRFQIYLGGTALPYPDRLPVLDDLLAREVPQYRRLAIGALSRVGQRHAGRSGLTTSPHEAREIEWQPLTMGELLDCHLAALDRLARAAESATQELHEALDKAALEISPLLREQPVREQAALFLQKAARRLPELRDPIRRYVSRILKTERLYSKQLSEADLGWIEVVESSLEDKSLGGRLHKLVGDPDLARKPEHLIEIAHELAQNQDVLQSEWSWLTAGDAPGAWDLGTALSSVDTKGTLLGMMSELQGGPDLRILASYLRDQAARKPDGWLDDWLDAWEREHPNGSHLLVEMTWRCAATDRGAARIERLVRSGRVTEAALRGLAYGGWCLGPTTAAFASLLDALLTNASMRLIPAEILDARLDGRKEDWPALEALAVRTITDASALEAGQMPSYHWKLIADRLLPRHAREIVRSILPLHGRKNDTHWFIEFSDAKPILNSCVEADAVAVWEELVPYLEDEQRDLIFTVGFPAGVIDRVPRNLVIEWIKQRPARRAAVVAGMTLKSFWEGTLGAELLHRFGQIEHVSSAFFSEFISGGFSGLASEHWQALASQLEETATKSSLSGVRKWAKAGAKHLRAMAERDRKREEEERLRGYGGG